jgi:hypothetical protein
MPARDSLAIFACVAFAAAAGPAGEAGAAGGEVRPAAFGPSRPPPDAATTPDIPAPEQAAEGTVLDLRVVSTPVMPLVAEFARVLGAPVIWRVRPAGVIENWSARGVPTEILSAICRSHNLFMTYDGVQLEVFDARSVERAVIDGAGREERIAAEAERLFRWTSAPIVSVSEATHTAVVTAPHAIVELVRAQTATVRRQLVEIEVIRGGQVERRAP